MNDEARARRTRNDARCRRLLERSALLDTDDLDWEAVAATPLEEPVLRCLVYMRDVEGFTDRDFTGMAAHPTTWADPLLRDFFLHWRAEEREHARAIDRFLTVYADGRAVPDLPPTQAPPPPVASTPERALVTLSRPLGHVVAATHMAWGATNELLTLNGYRLLQRRCRHPVLTELLDRIAAQESRHYSFYLLQVEWRLAASHMVRTLVRQLLRRTWTPVGVGADFKSPAEFGAVAAYLGSGPDGAEATRRMDRTIDGLPGMAGIGLYRRALNGLAA
jgi:rubrerythrin